MSGSQFILQTGTFLIRATAVTFSEELGRVTQSTFSNLYFLSQNLMLSTKGFGVSKKIFCGGGDGSCDGGGGGNEL